jgi:hypothetical protein
MRVISVAGAVILATLLIAISPVPAMDFTLVPPVCGAHCCVPQACCCHVSTPTSGPVAPATVIPTLTSERSPLVRPVLATFNSVKQAEADGAWVGGIIVVSGKVLPLYVLSHAFLI